MKKRPRLTKAQKMLRTLTREQLQTALLLCFAEHTGILRGGSFESGLFGAAFWLIPDPSKKAVHARVKGISSQDIRAEAMRRVCRNTNRRLDRQFAKARRPIGELVQENKT